VGSTAAATSERSCQTRSCSSSREGKGLHTRRPPGGSGPGSNAQAAPHAGPATFGRFEVDERTHTFTYYVEGSLVAAFAIVIGLAAGVTAAIGRILEHLGLSTPQAEKPPPIRDIVPC